MIAFPKVKKKKKDSRKSIIKRLDSLVSKIVINRDRFCVQCGSTTQLTCGHLFSRRMYSLRWDLRNVFCQCWPCNFRHTHNPQPYTHWFINKLGIEHYNTLYENSRKLTHLKDKDLLEIEARLTDMLNTVDKGN